MVETLAVNHVETQSLEQYVPRETLQDEISYLRRNWLKDGLSSDWRLLANTGFQVGTHVDMLYRAFHEDD